MSSRRELEARGQPLDDGHEAGAVGLAGGREAQGRHSPTGYFPRRRYPASPVMDER